MSGWAVTLWRFNARGAWSEVRTVRGEQAAGAAEEVRRLNAAGPDLYVALPVGEIPSV